MVQQNPAAGVPATSAAPEERHYSKDYWDLVLEQLGRRKLFKFALAVLTLLYGVAAAAPLLVNDKPYRIDLVDVDAYDSNLRNIYLAALDLQGRVAKSDEEYAKLIAGKPAAAPSRGAALAVDSAAAARRLEELRSVLPPEHHPRLDEVARLLAELRAAFGVDAKFFAGVDAAGLLSASKESRPDSVPAWGGPQDLDEAKRLVKELKTLGKTLGVELGAWRPSAPDVAGVDLLGVRHRPLLEALAPWEIGLLVLWTLWALSPAWNRAVNLGLLRGDRERIRRARRWKVGVVLALVVGSSVLWRVTVGPGIIGLDTSPYKQGLQNGKIALVAEGRAWRESLTDPSAVGEVRWAPVNYGYDESSMIERFRAVTWRAEGEIDAKSGRYTHPKWAGDPNTAKSAEKDQPLVILSGEPAANAWNRRIAGTDELGRDFFGRLIWGSRVSMTVGLVSALLLTTIGVLIGSLAGFFGGWVDVVVMRLIEIMQSIPSFFLILLAMAFTASSEVPPMLAIVVVIGLVGWTGVARLVRGEFMRLRDQDFVVAARALGFSNARTIFRHVLPNAMSPVLVAGAFAVASGILIESAVSFLGFGVKAPDASWGSLVNETRSPDYWWIQVFPGFLIFLTVTCYNLVGDAVRDALDPKHKL